MNGDMVISGLVGLEADLQKAAASALPAMRVVAESASKELETLWRANARRTAGKHGRWYPSSITSEVKTGFASVDAEVGPDKSKKQGRMGRGFEYGSVHQPPHLDGTNASRVVEPHFYSAITLAAGGLL